MMKKPNGSAAGRLEMIRSLLGGEAVFDDDGNPTGELTTQIITEEQAKKLISMDAPADVIEIVEEVGKTHLANQVLKIPVEQVEWRNNPKEEQN